ncbi:MAG: NAD(P)H-quinone oxidoreductase subunit D4, partial [Cyanobacteria bacterium P01_G01_bin.4]
LVFQGSYQAFPLQTILCVVGSGLTTVYFIILLNRTCFGRLDNSIAYFPKVEWRERVPAFILAISIVFFGVQPVWMVRWTEPTTEALVAAMPTLQNEQVVITETTTPELERPLS